MPLSLYVYCSISPIRRFFLRIRLLRDLFRTGGLVHSQHFGARPPMRRKEFLELVHTNVCQVDTKSHVGAQYFVTFIVDHKWKLWVSPLKMKDQVLSIFKEFHARVERETDRKLKVVREGNGGEYRGQFEEYCWSKGIWLEYIVQKTLELNGVAERMNRTIMERVWSMLAHANLSKMFWAEALTTKTYVINRSPSPPLDGDVPQRVCTNKDISYRHLKVFGCLAYMHVAKDKRGKLDPKTHPCIFVGYIDNEFVYGLWNLEEKKVIRSRDIVFMEEKTIVDWESEKRTTSSVSTNRDRLEETRVHPDESRISVEEQYEPVGFRQETEASRRGQHAKTEQDPELDLDEEPTEEPVAETKAVDIL